MTADRISRTRLIDGVVVPAFIHNGGHFLINLQVFADGMIECWDLVDLRLFRDKLQSGWVVPGAPDGAHVSVTHLADWTIADPKWDLKAEDLYDRVVSKVRELNPRMENLYDCHGRTTEVVDGVNVAISPSTLEQPVRVTEPGWRGKRVRGDKLSVLVRDGDYHLGDLRIFADGVVEIGRLAVPETLDLEGLSEAVASGRIVSSVPAHGRVRIHGLGSFSVKEENFCADAREQLREVHDLVAKLNGRSDSIARCRDAYAAYIAAPTEEAKEALRVAYAAVPEHTRMYVGDMDTRDTAVRMILFGEQEIEGWSHRIVARAQGIEPLPDIRVPKPRKKGD